jgi:hypothetical protein
MVSYHTHLYFMLYHASWVRMLAFRWLVLNFRFHACHLYIPRLALPALSSTSLFQLHPTHLLLLRTLQLYIIFVKTQCLVQTQRLLDISHVLYILSACH